VTWNHFRYPLHLFTTTKLNYTWHFKSQFLWKQKKESSSKDMTIQYEWWRQWATEQRPGIKSCSHYYRHLTAFRAEDNHGNINSPPPPPLHPYAATAPSGWGLPHDQSLTITLRHVTLGRIHLDKWPAWRRGLYLTTHNNHRRETSMPPERFKTAIVASEQPRNHALDQYFSTFVRSRPGKFFFHKTKARSQQIYS